MQTKIVCYWIYSPTMPGYQYFKSACRETLSLIVMQWCQGFADEWSEWIVSRGVGNNCLFVYLGPGQGLCRERNRWVCEVKIVSGGMQTKIVWMFDRVTGENIHQRYRFHKLAPKSDSGLCCWMNLNAWQGLRGKFAPDIRQRYYLHRLTLMSSSRLWEITVCVMGKSEIKGYCRVNILQCWRVFKKWLGYWIGWWQVEIHFHLLVFGL